MDNAKGSSDWISHYGIAVLAVMLTTIACVLIGSTAGGYTPLSLFFPAVLASVFYGGIGPGYLAATLSTLAAIALGALDRDGFQLADVIRIVIAAAGFFMACALVQSRENKIRGSMDALSAALAATMEGVIRLKPNGRIVETNELFADLIGSTRPALQDRLLLQLVVAEDRERVVKAGKECWSEGRAEMDVKVLWRGAAPHDVHMTFVRSDSAKGRPLGMYCFVKDVEKRKKELEEIRQSKERLEVAFRHGITGMSVADIDGIFLEVNPAFCEMLGYTPEQLVSRHLRTITHPDDIAQDMEFTGKLAGGEIEHYIREKRFISKSGETVWVRVSKEVVHDENGKPAYMVSQVQELSRESKA